MKIIDRFKTLGGHHCITNSLKQIFTYYGCPLSEEMIFGIGSGLGFAYVNLANAPMISGRIKPFEFEENIAKALRIGIKIKSAKNVAIAMEKVKQNIDHNRPVMLYVDMVYLKYMNLDENSHFGGHSIIIFGYDDEKSVFYVSDRDNEDFKISTPKGEIGENYHLVPYAEMKEARSSNFRPFPPNNNWIEFDFSEIQAIGPAILKASIKKNLNEMLNPPAQLLGINGIRKFAKALKKWHIFSLEQFKLAGCTNYYMIDKDGGTGGGAFRIMYGHFLIEASKVISELENQGEAYIEIGTLWEAIAVKMLHIYEHGEVSILEEMSEDILKIASREELVMQNILSELKV
ncbi:BtrH N-terminal domain-containing protein [Fusibacter sp. 3D3]|uniref:BtrH N-terminal domain-containing protein n=1 Tax=Fusibacter sp. 3D3 TaxID=1048380 RepID=UPI0008533763|nr:BtrH N-terminal domain-containing protein [Fusibacter sp. 3D3]GAU79126.1 hypothetical protein F3D3_3764 [Fusibacter sp. 3D3]